MLTRNQFSYCSYWLWCGLVAVVSPAMAHQELVQSAAGLGLPSPSIALYENIQPRYLSAEHVIADSAVVTWLNGLQSIRWLTQLDSTGVESAVTKVTDCVLRTSGSTPGCLGKDMLIATRAEQNQWEWMETYNQAQCQGNQPCTNTIPPPFAAEWQTNPNFTLYSVYRGRGEAVLMWFSRHTVTHLYHQALALGRTGSNQLLEHDNQLNLAISVTFQQGNIYHQLQAGNSDDNNTVLIWTMRMAVPL